MIRPIEHGDVPWFLSLANKRYPEADPGGTLIALSQLMRQSTALTIRSDHGFLVAHILAPVWIPTQRSAHILAICTEEGHHWEAPGLLRYSVVWAREEGCQRWFVSSETKHRIHTLAHRIGASAVPYYGIEITRETLT